MAVPRAVTKWTLVIASLALVTATSACASARSTVDQPAANLASNLTTLPASTRQVVIVHATSANTTHATLETFTKTATGWQPAFPAMSARVGSKGLTTHHIEGIPATPEGMFAFGSTFYGVNADPGVKFAYHRLVANDWWDEYPPSPEYNRFEHVSVNPGGASEALWKQTHAYQYYRQRSDRRSSRATG